MAERRGTTRNTSRTGARRAPGTPAAPPAGAKAPAIKAAKPTAGRRPTTTATRSAKLTTAAGQSGTAASGSRPTRTGQTRAGQTGAGQTRAAQAGASRRKKRKSTGRRRSSVVRTIFRFVGKWAAVLAIWGVIVLTASVIWLAHDLPSIDRVAFEDNRPSIAVMASDGSLVARYGALKGDLVRVDTLPSHVVGAVLAIEDRRFYSHFGIDPIGLVRAAWTNWRVGHVAQGGSTITQQLAKVLFLTPERTVRRKIQEALLAIWLEINYSKDDLLAAYLNRVYLGAGAYGVDAAAQVYYGVPARDLTLRQAATIAGLIQAPSRYAPTHAPERAEARSQVVLGAMARGGFITDGQRQAAAAQPPPATVRPTAGSAGRYFGDWIVDLAPDYVGLETGDMIVATTMDSRFQRLAAEVIESALAETGDPNLQAALVAMDLDGAVRALIGGRAYSLSQFNRATQARRQPGSAFKPFVYLAAIENGFRPDTVINDGPVSIGGYSPGNFRGQYYGPMTITAAMARSANSVAVQLANRVGVRSVIDAARRSGITSDMGADLSLALGTSEVSLLEITAAYSAFPTRGRPGWPYGVQTIRTRDGAVVHRRDGSGPGETIRPWHADEMNAILSAVVTHGTGRGADPGRPAGGKTGTTQDGRDAWFVGYTADMAIGVWVGRDDARPVRDLTGSGLPAEIWRRFAIGAHDGLPVRAIPGAGGGVMQIADPAPVQSPGQTPGQPPDQPPDQTLDRDGFGGLLDRLLGG